MKLAPVRALEFLSAGKFKATNHRVLWNKKSSSKSQIYDKFLNQSLKKFIEYQR